MEQENKPRLYVVMTQEILCRKDLSTAAKLVFARMSGFEEFFESPEKTGEVLGKSRKTVVMARQELEKAGLIRCVKNTGRGKAYCVVLDSRVVENDQSDYQKNSTQSARNVAPYNKVENKDYNTSNKLDGADAQVDDAEKTEYGNHEVNELMALWKSETGIEASSAKANRLAAYNLIRGKGFDEAQKIVKLCGRAMRSKDQYAPVISSFKDLQGRYEKLSKLLAWEKRQNIYTTNPTQIRKAVEDWADEYEPTDEERKANLAKFREMRKKLGI